MRSHSSSLHLIKKIIKWEVTLEGRKVAMLAGKLRSERRSSLVVYFLNIKVGFGGFFLWSHTNLHVTLSGQVVNLRWPRLTDDLHQTHAVCQIAIVQLHVCQTEPKPHTDPLFSKAEHINKQSCFCLMGYLKMFHINFQQPHHTRYDDPFGCS